MTIMKLYPAIDLLIQWLVEHERDVPAISYQVNRFIHSLQGLSIKNKILYGGYDFDGFCKMMLSKGCPMVRTRNSVIFTLIPPVGKVVVTPTPDGYDLDFIKDERYFLTEKEVKELE